MNYLLYFIYKKQTILYIKGYNLHIFFKWFLRLPEKYNPDEACHGLGFCFTDEGHKECSLFPKPKVSKILWQ
jgi:hypothetical protein